MENECVRAFTHLEDKYNATQALYLLKRVASLVKPLMKKRSWVLPLLSEFFPDNPKLYGQNVNAGQQIHLRLRPAHDPDTLMREEVVVQTMLHELTHNVHSKHNVAFYKYMTELQDEYSNLVKLGHDGDGFLSTGRMLVSSPYEDIRVPPNVTRIRALESAQKRAKALRTVSASGRIGGHSVADGLSRKQLIAQVAGRKLQDDQSCGSVTDINVQAEIENANKNKVKTQANQTQAIGAPRKDSEMHHDGRAALPMDTVAKDITTALLPVKKQANETQDVGTPRKDSEIHHDDRAALPMDVAEDDITVEEEDIIIEEHSVADRRKLIAQAAERRLKGDKSSGAGTETGVQEEVEKAHENIVEAQANETQDIVAPTGKDSDMYLDDRAALPMDNAAEDITIVPPRILHAKEQANETQAISSPGKDSEMHHDDQAALPMDIAAEDTTIVLPRISQVTGSTMKSTLKEDIAKNLTPQDKYNSKADAEKLNAPGLVVQANRPTAKDRMHSPQPRQRILISGPSRGSKVKVPIINQKAYSTLDQRPPANWRWPCSGCKAKNEASASVCSACATPMAQVKWYEKGGWTCTACEQGGISQRLWTCIWCGEMKFPAR